VIRKWSYINNYTLYNSLQLRTTPIYDRFKLKIFRKNTRFKKYNNSYTFFTRKIVALRSRRLSWKSYIILSSGWVKLYLSFKKLVTYTQNNLMYNYSTHYAFSKMFLKKSPLLNLIGINMFSISYSFFKNTFTSFFTNKLSLNTNVVNKTRKVRPVAQFNSLSTPSKLNAVGFNFTTNLFNSHVFYPIRVPKPLYTILYPNTTLNLITNHLTSLRSVHVYLTLLHLFKKSQD
jgi:hypothetical protein